MRAPPAEQVKGCKFSGGKPAADKINKQIVEIHKMKHEYQLWKIKHAQPVSDESNSRFKETMISDILKDLDKHISYIDYELEEMKEQQLCVDLSIEKYYKKVTSYPKGLKMLFDMGTTLLNSFEAFWGASERCFWPLP